MQHPVFWSQFTISNESFLCCHWHPVLSCLAKYWFFLTLLHQYCIKLLCWCSEYQASFKVVLLLSLITGDQFCPSWMTRWQWNRVINICSSLPASTKSNVWYVVGWIMVCFILICTLNQKTSCSIVFCHWMTVETGLISSLGISAQRLCSHKLCRRLPLVSASPIVTVSASSHPWLVPIYIALWMEACDSCTMDTRQLETLSIYSMFETTVVCLEYVSK